MRPLRVLHVTPYSADAWAYGGIPRVLGALTTGLARRGHHVTVCTTDVCDRRHRLPAPLDSCQPGSDPDQTPSGTTFAPWPVMQTADGVSVRVFPNLSNRIAYDWQMFLPVGLGAYLQRSAASFDVAHLHACRNLPGAIAVHHLRRAGVPYVIAPHGTAPRIERRRFAKRLFDAALGTRTMRHASRLIALSEAERVQLTAMGATPDSIRVVPNPIDLDEFTPPPPRGGFRRAIGGVAAPLVLFLGRLSPRKRVDDLVRAFGRLRRPDARLVIAGNDMGGGASARALADASGVADRTTFVGLLSGRERLDALADADVVVYPSEHEIFGLVPLEAMLCGTPVVVAGDSGCAEVVGAAGGGRIVPVGNTNRLADAIDEILAQPLRWRARAADAAVRVRAAYAPDRVCASLDDVYRELVTA